MTEDQARSVCCGGNTTFILTLSGRALSCGCNEDNQLGWPRENAASAAAAAVDVTDGGGEEDGGGGYGGPSAVVDEDTSLFDYLALKQGEDGTLVQITCGKAHGAALTCDGRVVTWGSAEGGRLGRDKKKRGDAAHSRPAAVAIPEAGQNIVSVSAGGAHTVAVSASGWLWVWGTISREVSYSSPHRVQGEVLGSGHFLRAHAGAWSTLVVAIPPPAEEEEGF